MAGGGETFVNSSLLCCVHINLNSLVNKVNFVKDTVESLNIDILAISETWLNGEINDATIDIPEFNLIRNDSPSGIRKHGVAIYIARALNYEVITVDLPNLICLRLIDLGIYFVAVYRPPSYLQEDNSRLIDFLSRFADDKEVCIMGDFNLPSLDWKRDIPPDTYITPTDRMFLDCFSAAGLSQVVLEPTNFPSNNTIDICLVSDEERVGSCEVLPPLPNCSHGIVKVLYTFQYEPADSDTQLLPEHRSRIWSRANFAGMRTCLDQIDLDSHLRSFPADYQYDIFLDAYRALEDRFVPKHKADNAKNVPWSINPPRALKRAKNNAWNEYKESRRTYGRTHPTTMQAWYAFEDKNTEIKMFATNSQIEYEKKVASQINTKPKLFHSYVRHRKVGKPSVGPLKLCTGEMTDDPSKMAEALAVAFSGVYAGTAPSDPEPHQTCNSFMPDILITPLQVREVLLDLDVNSSGGSDGIHPRFLKEFATELSGPLSSLFNNSLDDGILPIEWLNSVVVPIFKKGSRFTALNYRPVSLITSGVCKSLEILILRGSL